MIFFGQIDAFPLFFSIFDHQLISSGSLLFDGLYSAGEGRRSQLIYKNNKAMANKRDLKKSINYICRDLFAEGVAAYLYGPAKSEEQYNAMLSTLLVVRNDFVHRISHPEPGMKPRVYFNTLKRDFEQQVNDLIDQISSI